LAKYINEGIEKIKTFFSTDWWAKYKFEQDLLDDTIRKQQLISFTQDLEDLKEGIFDCFNASLLVGEYVKCDDFHIKINEVITSLDGIPQLIPPHPDVQTLLLHELKLNFIECLKIGLSQYENLYKLVKHKFSIDNRQFLFHFNTELTVKLKEDSFTKSSSENLLFFDANIKVAQADHFLTAEVKSYKELLEISYELVKSSIIRGNKYSILLKNKCDFLISKWIVRKNHTSKYPLYTIKDNVEILARPEEFTNTFYPKWKNYIESQYETSSNWKHIIETDFDKIKNKRLDSLSLSELNRCIKYYKDITKDLLNLDALCNEINRRYDESKQTGKITDIYAYSMSLNYVMNNKFSLLLDDNKRSEEEIDNLYNKILSIQSATRIKNFFPQLKLLRFYVDKLQKLYNNRKPLESIALVSRKYIRKCEGILEDYLKNVEWAESKYNYIFQLPFSECLIDTDNLNLPQIYIASSFVLPLPKSIYKAELEENKQKIHLLNASIEVYENMEKDVAEITKDKEDIQKRDIRSMEILGIFTAIVTFVAGTLPTFQFIKSAYQAGLFLLALSTSLSVFVLLILSVTRGLQNFKKHLKLILSITGATFALWIGMVFFTHDPSLKEDVMNKKLDSLTALINKENHIKILPVDSQKIVRRMDTVSNQQKLK